VYLSQVSKGNVDISVGDKVNGHFTSEQIFSDRSLSLME
jgi:hypothetical protein